MAVYRTEKQRIAIADAQADEMLRMKIRALIGMLGSGEAVAIRAGMSSATLYRRLRNPGDLTMSEMRALRRLEEKTVGGGTAWQIGA